MIYVLYTQGYQTISHLSSAVSTKFVRTLFIFYSFTAITRFSSLRALFSEAYPIH
jgi:hypothetical protein